MKKLILALSLLTVVLFTQAQTVYTADMNHTKIGFSVTHFGISHVEGRFKVAAILFKASKEDFSDATIEMIAEVKSIDTDIDMRDKDLKSNNWFDADKFPSVIFKSTAFTKVSGNNYKMDGNITMHGITKPISFDVVYNGKNTNPMNKKTSVGFTITGKLNRTDFGVGAAGGAVSDEIVLSANVELVVE